MLSFSNENFDGLVMIKKLFVTPQKLIVMYNSSRKYIPLNSLMYTEEFRPEDTVYIMLQVSRLLLTYCQHFEGHLLDINPVFMMLYREDSKIM